MCSGYSIYLMNMCRRTPNKDGTHDTGQKHIAAVYGTDFTFLNYFCFILFIHLIIIIFTLLGRVISLLLSF